MIVCKNKSTIDRRFLFFRNRQLCLRIKYFDRTTESFSCQVFLIPRQNGVVHIAHNRDCIGLPEAILRVYFEFQQCLFVFGVVFMLRKHDRCFLRFIEITRRFGMLFRIYQRILIIQLQERKKSATLLASVSMRFLDQVFLCLINRSWNVVIYGNFELALLLLR